MVAKTSKAVDPIDFSQKIYGPDGKPVLEADRDDKGNLVMVDGQPRMSPLTLGGVCYAALMRAKAGENADLQSIDAMLERAKIGVLVLKDEPQALTVKQANMIVERLPMFGAEVLYAVIKVLDPNRLVADAAK